MDQVLINKATPYNYVSNVPLVLLLRKLHNYRPKISPMYLLHVGNMLLYTKTKNIRDLSKLKVTKLQDILCCKGISEKTAHS